MEGWSFILLRESRERSWHPLARTPSPSCRRSVAGSTILCVRGRQKDEPVWQAMSKGRRKLFKSADGALSFAVNKKFRRLVKRFVQQGHSERRAESYLDGTLRV